MKTRNLFYLNFYEKSIIRLVLGESLAKNVAVTKKSGANTTELATKKVYKKLVPRTKTQQRKTVFHRFSEDKKDDKSTLNDLGAYLFKKKYDGKTGRYGTKIIESNATGSKFFTAEV